MQTRPFLLSLLALAAFALPASITRGGDSLPSVDLDEFGQTKAKSFEDFSGRAVLMEFFAFW